MELLNFLLHIDTHLVNLINQFGPIIYVVLFLIIFCETGLVVTPFLPGDSILFVIGTLAGSGHLNIWIIYFSLLAAAILGDTLNYYIGHRIGPKVFSQKNSRFFKKEYLEKTEKFYEKYGGRAIIIARFLPIVRTFAPFVAGVGKMHYATFALYNVIGALLWITGLTFAGFFFGSLPLVKDNFEAAIMIIIALSLVPAIFEYLKHHVKSNNTKTKKEHPND